MDHKLFDPAHADRLDDPDRLSWLPPAIVLNRIGIASGSRVADIGAGTGFFTLPLAGLVGDAGMVYAIDLQPEMLARLDRKLSAADRVWPVALVHADATDTTLPDASCDLVFASTIWHELPDHRRALDEARRLLAPGGRLAIVDWRPDVDRPPGPRIEHRLGADTVATQLGSARWAVDLNEPVGAYTWLIVAHPISPLRLVK